MPPHDAAPAWGLGECEIGKNRIRKTDLHRFGLLYERLIVMPGQSTFPVYYHLVRKVFQEAKDDWKRSEDKDAWFAKWFGV